MGTNIQYCTLRKSRVQSEIGADISMIPGIAEREAPFGNVGLHNIHTAPALSGRFLVLVPLRPRRGGGGVVDGWGRLRRPRPAPLPPFSTLAWDSTRRCAP